MQEFDGFVPLPTPARGYASSRLLLIDIYAAYAQRGVELYRYSPGTAAAFVRLKCLRGHWRTGCVDTCKVRLALRREDDGRWHFVSEAGAHNHPLGDGDGHPMDVDGEREGDSDELSEPSDDESEAEWDAAQDDARADDEVERQGRMAPEPVEADRLVHQPLSKIRQSVQVLAQVTFFPAVFLPVSIADERGPGRPPPLPTPDQRRRLPSPRRVPDLHPRRSRPARLHHVPLHHPGVADRVQAPLHESAQQVWRRPVHVRDAGRPKRGWPLALRPHRWIAQPPRQARRRERNHHHHRARPAEARTRGPDGRSPTATTRTSARAQPSYTHPTNQPV